MSTVRRGSKADTSTNKVYLATLDDRHNYWIVWSEIGSRLDIYTVGEGE